MSIAENRADRGLKLGTPFWIILVFSGIVWIVRYAARFGLDLSAPPQWAHYFDQQRYIASALAFGHGDVSASQHWYPLAYPLLAAPFAWLIPAEPFFLPDLIFFVATAFLFAVVMRRLGVNPALSIILFLVGDMAVGRVARLWLQPWTTSLSAPLIWGLIAQALAIVDRPANGALPQNQAMFRLGLLAGALPLARPTDALTALIAVVFVMTTLQRQKRLWPGAGWIVLGGLVLCIPYGLVHLAIYGPRISDYALDAAKQGFAFGDLPWKAYVVLVTAAPWFPNSPSLVEGMPWIIPGIAGLVVHWRNGDHRARVALGLIAAIAIPYCASFLAYTDLQPPGVWGFSNAHYFKWLFPLVTVGAWLWLREFRSWRGAGRAIAVVAILLVPTAFRPMPVAVPDSVPARMLMFRGATDRNWDSAYFAPATITDAKGTLINVGRFHQVPDAYGERAVAVWRLFDGPALRNDPGEALPYKEAERPYARYAVRISPGIPCWVSRQAVCRMPRPE